VVAVAAREMRLGRQLVEDSLVLFRLEV